VGKSSAVKWSFKTCENKNNEKETLSRIALLTKVFRYFENGLKTSKRARNIYKVEILSNPRPHKKASKSAIMPDRFTKGKTNAWSKVL
jgi:hypothetical protein